MKLTQEPCPTCHHITEKENPTCPTCGCTKKLTPERVWSLGVATIGRTYPTGTVQ
jgi:RNA polymerase subunit RPABC4/transcription elongation factor Spt4